MALLSILAKLGLDKTGFDSSLTQAGKQVNRFGSDLKGAIAGAFSVAVITAFAKRTIEAASRISDLAKQLGVSSEAMQEFDFAAKQSGASIDDIATSFKGLARARDEALGDSGSKAAGAFRAMGISQQELAASNIEQIFRRIAGVFKTTDFGAQQLVLVQELLGKSGTTLLPMFKDGLTEAGEEARKLGLIIEDEIVSKLDDAGDKVDSLIARSTRPMAHAISFVTDRIRDMVDFLDITIGGMGAYIGAFLEKLKQRAGGVGTWRFWLDSFDPTGMDSKLAHQAGAKAREEHVNEVLDRRIKEDARLEEKPKAAPPPASKDFDNLMQIVGSLFGAGKASLGRGGAVSAATPSAIQSDQFQRIGAFTGASAAEAQSHILREVRSEIQKLNRVVDAKGILIRGTD